MAKLETQLARTRRKIERMMEEGSDARRVTRFYSLVHQFEKLNDRYIKTYGHSYNPAESQPTGWEGDLVNQHE